MRRKDLTNIKFGKLTVQEMIYVKIRGGKKRAQCRCLCDCGSEIITVADSLTSGRKTSCGCRRQSSKEELIKNILCDNNISYISQYCIDDCRDKQPLPFDFAVFQNNELSFLIEYDGRQHYSPIPYFGGQYEFEKRVERDSIKDSYCMNNNIRLLRLPYTLTDREIETEISNIVYP